MAGGYWGKTLWIDLTNGHTHVETFDDVYARKYLGGCGLGAKIVSDHVTKNTNPLGPYNVLVFATGPYQATDMGGSGRCSACAKSPLTGYWGESNGGGKIGPQIKRCGFDAIAITGKSRNPVYLSLTDNKVEIKDASAVWGKDIVETTDALRAAMQDNTIGVTAIGQGGENLVRYACIANEKHGFFGRCGLGAVMGSKNLKAVVAKGSLKPVIAEPEKYKVLYEELRKNMLASPFLPHMRQDGQAMAMAPREQNGLLPMKNWSMDNWPEVEKISTPIFTEQTKAKPWACPYCYIGCHRRITNTDFYPTDTGGPEYETLAMIGSNLLIDDLAAQVRANEILNRYGIDTIDAGAVLAWAFECYENGLLTKEDTDGIELTWGNGDALVAMCEKIGKREGIGNLLAEGLRACVDTIPESKEYSVEAMGQAVAAHDPRAFFSNVVTTIASTRGSCHLHGSAEGNEGRGTLPELGINTTSDRFDNTRKGYIGAIYQDAAQINNCLTACLLYGSFGLTNRAKLLNYITGWDVTAQELGKIGERVNRLQHLFNIRMGMVPDQENVMPLRFTKPHKGGGAAGKVPDWRGIIKEYWQTKGWDQHGIPLTDKVKELGLEDTVV